MEATVQMVLMLYVFRLGCIAAACFLALLGFRLFVAGLYTPSSLGELEISRGGTRLALKQVGPGVFFALFAVAIGFIGVTFHPAMSSEIVNGNVARNSAGTTATKPDPNQRVCSSDSNQQGQQVTQTTRYANQPPADATQRATYSQQPSNR